LRLEAEALNLATRLQQQMIERGGGFSATTRQTLLDAYALKMMSQDA